MSKRKQFITERGSIYTNHDYIKIGNKQFEIIGAIDPCEFSDIIYRCQGLPTLVECYNTCSHEKQRIYCEWAEFAIEHKMRGIWGAHGIYSHNRYTFKFDCIITDGNENFYAHITPAHNYIYVCGKEV